MEIDRVPVSQLPSRYSIARSALYTRLKDLKIEPEKQGKKAFVNAAQLQQLDALHEHIQKGGTTGEFLKQHSCPGQLATQDSPGQRECSCSGQSWTDRYFSDCCSGDSGRSYSQALDACA
jgi:hypothetical protein